MRPALVEVLQSPCCRHPLDLTASESFGEEVVSGSLTCTGCGRVFDIVRRVPRFVVSDGYAGNFSFEWTRYRTLQLDSQGRHTWSREAFLEKTGIPLESLRGKRVLDVGCGIGRFSEIVLDHGGEAVAVDLSFAVESAQQNIGHRPSAHVVQADVFALPFRPESFDVVFSIGVLHHTPDTRRAFLALPGLVRPGGTIAVWVYAKGRWFEVVGDVLRLLTTRLPPQQLLALCRSCVPLLHRLRRLPVLGVPLHAIPVSCAGRGLEADILDTFDWYSPRYQWKHTTDEVLGWFHEAGLTQPTPQAFPVAVRGKKPRAV